LGIDVEIELAMAIEDPLGPAAELSRSGVAHRAAAAVFETVLQLAPLVVVVGVAAAQGIDPLVVGGDVGPVFIDLVAAVWRGGVHRVAATEGEDAAVGSFVAQLDAEALRRVADLDVPVRYAAVHFDLADDPLG